MNDLLRTLGVATALAGGAMLVASCASSATPQGLPLGSTQEQVIALMGPPTGRYKLDNGGTRLEFARGPQGRETYMVDFDAAGGSIAWDQVLTPQNFISLAYGISSEEVLMRIGHPGSTKVYPRQGITVWNYRYPTNNCLWYQVSIGADGKFQGAAHTTDPECETPSWR